MSESGSSQSRMVFLDRLQRLMEIENAFDLRSVTEGSTPEDADELIMVIREYGRFRRSQAQVTELEEFRRALPWIFESPETLQAAIETVIESAMILGRDHQSTAQAMARAHPLAAPRISAAIERFPNPGAGSDDRAAARRLPAEFGPECLDGRPRYRLLARIGSGPNGDVFQSVDREAYICEPTATVAVKVLKQTPSNLRHASRMMQWIESTRSIATDGISQTLDAGVAPSGEPFLVAKLIADHRSIAETAFSGREGVRRAVRLIAKAARAVEPLHASGHAHGWLKPSNILVSESETVMLTDLGLWAARPENLDASGSYSVGAALGFLAPELFNVESKPNPATDVYSLGAILYWMMTGRLANGDDAQHAHSLLMDGKSSARQYPEHVPADLIGLCEHALAVNPNDRIGSTALLRVGLETWLSGRSVPGYTTGWLHRRKCLVTSAKPIGASVGMAALFGLLIHIDAQYRWTRERERLFDQRMYESKLAAFQIEKAQENAATIERYTRESIANSHQAITSWVLEMSNPATSSSPFASALLDVVASLPITTAEQRDILVPRSADTARTHADQNAGLGTMESMFWDLLAGFKLHHAGNPICLPYLIRAKESMAIAGFGNDPWVVAIDQAIETHAPQRPRNPTRLSP